MKVKEMIDKLKTLDPETDLYVAISLLEWDLEVKDIDKEGLITVDERDFRVDDMAMQEREMELAEEAGIDAENRQFDEGKYRNKGED